MTFFICGTSNLRKKRNSKRCFLLLAASTVISVLLLSTHLRDRIPALLNWRLSGLFGSDMIEDDPTCRLPFLPVYNPEIMKHIKNVERINCSGAEADWVDNNGTHAFVSESAKAKFGHITCKFKEIERDGDLRTKLSEKLTQGQSSRFETSDFLEVDCVDGLHHNTWKSFLAAPRSKVKVHERQQSVVGQGTSLHPKLSVLMWGHDSLSRNMFIRKLPISFDFLKNKLGGTVVEGYNIVGDGTPQALIPILTGQTESELPETRKSHGQSAKFVDVYPFLWKEFRRNGYLTGYMEDCPDIGTFQYRLKGFKEQPTDFYLRTYFVAASKSLGQYKSYCIGSVPRHKIMMNYVQNIMTLRQGTPKFLFSFHSELSHGDVNLIQGADDDLKELLHNLNSSGVLNSTILVVMSDHGHRFASLRETQQGKLEERMPTLIFVFPSWFKELYPSAHRNFMVNIKILSTPFDLHETLQDVLHFTGAKSDDERFKTGNPIRARGMSLFKEIPENRTCTDAAIEPHWCACLQWHFLSPNSSIVQRAAKEIVNFLNNLTKSSRAICSILDLSQVLWSASLYPKDDLMKFKKSRDVDGRLPDLSDKAAVTRVLFQLKLETFPGFGRFEASINYDVKSDSFEIMENEISRINKYGSQADCVETNELESLRKYCYCSHSPKTPPPSSPYSSL